MRSQPTLLLACTPECDDDRIVQLVHTALCSTRRVTLFVPAGIGADLHDRLSELANQAAVGSLDIVDELGSWRSPWRRGDVLLATRDDEALVDPMMSGTSTNSLPPQSVSTDRSAGAR